MCERVARCMRCRCVCSGGMDAGVGEVAVGMVGVAGVSGVVALGGGSDCEGPVVVRRE